MFIVKLQNHCLTKGKKEKLLKPQDTKYRNCGKVLTASLILNYFLFHLSLITCKIITYQPPFNQFHLKLEFFSSINVPRVMPLVSHAISFY